MLVLEDPGGEPLEGLLGAPMEVGRFLRLAIAIAAALTQLHRRGVDVVAIAGRDSAHARQLVEGALERGMDALVVVGGDGIISLALQVLAQTDIPLGIVPAGTGNDHAQSCASIMPSQFPKTCNTSSINYSGRQLSNQQP